MMSDYSYEQIDCAWILSDKVGNVAAFTTGGEGPIPDCIMRNNILPVPDIEELIMNYPEICDAIILINIKRPDGFLDIAKRGIFVYDWRDIHRPISQKLNVYELVAVPNKPQKMWLFDGLISNFLNEYKCGAVDFSNTHTINVKELPF